MDGWMDGWMDGTETDSKIRQYETDRVMNSPSFVMEIYTGGVDIDRKN
jgi:hypothetical protein